MTPKRFPFDLVSPFAGYAAAPAPTLTRHRGAAV